MRRLPWGKAELLRKEKKFRNLALVFRADGNIPEAEKWEEAANDCLATIAERKAALTPEHKERLRRMRETSLKNRAGAKAAKTTGACAASAKREE